MTLGEGSRVIVDARRRRRRARLTRQRLRKLGVEVLADRRRPDAEALEQQIAEWTSAGPMHGVYWLPALDDEGPLDALDPAAGARACASA